MITPTETESEYLRQIFHYLFKSSIGSDDVLELATVTSHSCDKNITLVQPLVKLILDFKVHKSALPYLTCELEH